MGLHNMLLESPSFTFEKNVFYQKEYLRQDLFEKKYVDLRQQENRVYSDAAVRNLPDFHHPGPLKKEWLIRKITMAGLIKYFNKRERKPTRILELGCGNGWLCHQLAVSLNSEILGLDINETELWQGANLFKDCQNLSFMAADVFTVEIQKGSFDFIILAGSVQYFPDFTRLIHRLLELLSPSGEIHIVDSPIYDSWIDSQEAKKRSNNYFNAQGVPAMADYYFHHHTVELKKFNHRVLYKPNYWVSMFSRRILGTPHRIFPWILIKHD